MADGHAGMLQLSYLPSSPSFRYRSAMADNSRSDSSLTHSQLIERVAQLEDRHAFMLLFSYFGPRLKSFMLRSGATEGQAEDLAQEALLTVWRKAQSFDARKATASTWIFTIARNLRIDTLRRGRLAANGQRQLLGPDGLLGEVDQPDRIMQASQYAERLRQAMKGLSPEQYRLLQMAFFEDMPHQEIAKTLNIPLGTVKSRIRRSMMVLREVLEDLR